MKSKIDPASPTELVLPVDKKKLSFRGQIGRYILIDPKSMPAIARGPREYHGTGGRRPESDST